MSRTFAVIVVTISILTLALFIYAAVEISSQIERAIQIEFAQELY